MRSIENDEISEFSPLLEPLGLSLNEDALVQLNEARRIAPKDAYTLFHASCLYALLDQPENAIATLCEAQARGYYLQSELLRNSDLDSLRGLDAFQELTG